ncbi:dihydroxyacetone kinase subunit DhaK [Alicyclobacillus acidoterrestris]|uniref:phosphoenolpyruvate--glycerone phosphotransferase n=1 Tax=Alicyclobacillus acidoterrestris (strain ATCC 49025 / DSM 3922 / CIP 106132 / NCIMB 13137 / GD3B) TaxID=1356854 RepID=T0CU63_ALIAG|nr:dihydroxyacetone kinase subunit DhaK [Alicyclobacillus acidoterrestris]EPZ42942.1 hypothetical protein N007_14150 [Alicyclobacillus acidoterrestris ATCC 49025]UNO50041.1 dihydroxyacetone kinase subunit DhaK [Alicyclobacillus acidoterrestris]
MKKLMNEVGHYVDQMLDGMVLAHPELRRLPGTTVLVRAEKADKVALVSGGGSGHEPAHGGFVGPGMLDAAVAGEMFTSPTPDQILEAIRAVHGDQGVLLIVKNYTGDVMNFEMAAEMATMEGIHVEQVVVDDDVAVQNSTHTIGRRGIAGTVFVHKIAGAAAEAGYPLETVAAVAKRAIDNVHSMGVALSPCTVPASGQPSFQLADDEIEIGIGIHGEPGVRREPIRSADDVVDTLLDTILEDAAVQAGDDVAVLVNGLGATPLSELYIANRRIARRLAKQGVNIQQTRVAEYMTSLEMAGFSISLLKLDHELAKLLNAPATTTAWRS